AVSKGDNFVLSLDQGAQAVVDKDTLTNYCRDVTRQLAQEWGFKSTAFDATIDITTKEGGNVSGGGSTTFGVANGRAFGFEGTWRIGRLDRFCTDVVPHEIFHILLAHNRGQITPRCWD